MRPTLIIGNRGQDGRLLSDHLHAKGIDWLGINRSKLCDGTMTGRPTLVSLLEYDRLARFLEEFRPPKIFYLAAYHRSSEGASGERSAELQMMRAVHCDAVAVCLDTIARVGWSCHFFYASSSLIFDGSGGVRQTEGTEPRPQEDYGESKLAGMRICQEYRSARGVTASCGILYNHESHLRSPRFLSRKVVDAALSVKRGFESRLTVGDLQSSTDWGYAPDFVEAFEKVSCLNYGDDYIIATDRLHTVEDWLRVSFGRVGIDWREHVDVDPKLLKRRFLPKQGDYRKLKDATGWHPKTGFEDMVGKIMESLVT